MTSTFSVASGSSTFQPRRHQLVVAQPRQRRPDPDEEEDEAEGLDAATRSGRASRRPGPIQPPRKKVTAIPEIDEHLDVLGEHERAEAHAAVLGLVARRPARRRPRAGRTGARLVSAKPATMKIRKPTNWGTMYQISSCASTIEVSESEPAIITTPSSARPIEIS